MCIRDRDYSDFPFNIGGYICLEFSLLWGVGTLVVMRIVHPVVAGLVDMVPPFVGFVVMCVLLSLIHILICQNPPFLKEYTGDPELIAAAEKACAEAGVKALVGKIATGDLFVGVSETKAAIEAVSYTHLYYSCW